MQAVRGNEENIVRGKKRRVCLSRDLTQLIHSQPDLTYSCDGMRVFGRARQMSEQSMSRKILHKNLSPTYRCSHQ